MAVTPKRPAVPAVVGARSKQSEALCRYDATDRVTSAALAWLWHVQDCRVVSLEVGASFEFSRMSSVLEGHWRVDVAGAQLKKAGALHAHIVEVKATRADFLSDRELSGRAATRNPRNKWDLSVRSPFALWLAVGPDIRDEDLESLPRHWGILRASPDRYSLRQVRAAVSSGSMSGQAALETAYVLGRYSQAARLPSMGKSVEEGAKALARPRK